MVFHESKNFFGTYFSQNLYCEPLPCDNKSVTAGPLQYLQPVTHKVSWISKMTALAALEVSSLRIYLQLKKLLGPNQSNESSSPCEFKFQWFAQNLSKRHFSKTFFYFIDGCFIDLKTLQQQKIWSRKKWIERESVEKNLQTKKTGLEP